MKITGKTLSALMKEIIEPCASRELSGVAQKICFILAAAIAIYHLWTFTLGTYDVYVLRRVHACSLAALSFLTNSFSTKRSTRIPIIDIILALLSLGIMAYLVLNYQLLLYERLKMFPGSLTTLEIGMAVVLVLLILEAGRRATGSILGMLVVASLVYAYLGPSFPGMWRHGGYPLEQLMDFTIFSQEGLFGLPIGISATYIILFLIFAGLIQGSGAGDFFTDLAMAIAGKARGGTAKVAVISSALFGTLSGSAAANVGVTGSFTIPMMKKSGFDPAMAGAIEATASTGGPLVPPVMGGAVFIMAELTQTSYWNICLIAILPALLYYLGIFVQVHTYSVRHGIGGMDRITEKLPSVGQTLKRGWHYFLPFAAIVGLLAYGYSPIFSALWSMPVVIIVSWFHKDTRIGIKKLIKSLEYGAMVTRLVMGATGLSGILMGVIFYTGAGGTLVHFISSFTGGMLLPGLLISAGACLIFGLGLSAIASYLLTVILIIPAVVTLGVSPIAAHLFAIYFAEMAVITPPVGGVFFQAAAMAEAPPFSTGFKATRLAFAAFIAPFIWIYRPGLLLMGSPLDIIIALAIGIVAVSVMGFVIEGFFIRKLFFIERVILTLSVFALTFGTLVQNLAGVVVIIVVLFLHWVRAKKTIQQVQI